MSITQKDGTLSIMLIVISWCDLCHRAVAVATCLKKIFQHPILENQGKANEEKMMQEKMMIFTQAQICWALGSISVELDMMASSP